MKKMVKRLLNSRALAFSVYLAARVWLLFVSCKTENDQKWTALAKRGTPVLICLLHQQFFFIVRFFRKYLIYDPCLMISRSRDGEVGARVACHSGAKVARGSSTEGGREAMAEMIDHMKTGKGVCITLVDGPQGPAGKVKPGSVRMAQKAGACLVPCFFVSDNAWHLGSWDRFMIPKPFSKVIMRFGDPVFVGAHLTAQAFEAARRDLESCMAPYLVKKGNKDH